MKIKRDIKSAEAAFSIPKVWFLIDIKYPRYGFLLILSIQRYDFL